MAQFERDCSPDPEAQHRLRAYLNTNPKQHVNKLIKRGVLMHLNARVDDARLIVSNAKEALRQAIQDRAQYMSQPLAKEDSRR